MSKYSTFAALHVPGDPVVLYNIWDPGSAIAVAAAGAKALATGSHPVGDASGYGDAHQVPLDYVFDNARRIMKAVEILGRQDEDYGKFAWIMDPDGIKIELFQQIGGAP